MKIADLTFPLETVSGMNVREHWLYKSNRVKKERNRTAYALKKLNTSKPGPLITVTLSRISPRELDTDNLASALKGVRDQVACWLGVDDRSKLVDWQYRQAKGEKGVRVEIEVRS